MILRKIIIWYLKVLEKSLNLMSSLLYKPCTYNDIFQELKIKNVKKIPFRILRY